jgi:hypothetical protein
LTLLDLLGALELGAVRSAFLGAVLVMCFVLGAHGTLMAFSWCPVLDLVGM